MDKVSLVIYNDEDASGQPFAAGSNLNYKSDFLAYMDYYQDTQSFILPPFSADVSTSTSL